MNAIDVLFYGQRTVLRNLSGITDDQFTTPGVCGWWSVREIIAHLSSFEQVLIDVLQNLQGETATPCLDEYRTNGLRFNDIQVERRQGMNFNQIRQEFEAGHKRTLELMRQIPLEARREAGRLPWYGMEYDLEDFIAYQYYGHKREHSAQIAVFRDKLGLPPA